MIVVAVQHPVADYDAWKAVYDEAHPGTFGAKFARVNRAVDRSKPGYGRCWFRIGGGSQKNDRQP